MRVQITAENELGKIEYRDNEMVFCLTPEAAYELMVECRDALGMVEAPC